METPDIVARATVLLGVVNAWTKKRRHVVDLDAIRFIDDDNIVIVTNNTQASQQRLYEDALLARRLGKYITTNLIRMRYAIVSFFDKELRF